MSKRHPRQVDVARRAGVSPAIVSLVLNDKLGDEIRISPQTVERVRAAMRELSDMPNPVARSLATGQNRILGVFIYEPVFPLQTESFYFPFLVGIEDEAEAKDYDLLLFTRSRRDAGHAGGCRPQPGSRRGCPPAPRTSIARGRTRRCARRPRGAPASCRYRITTSTPRSSAFSTSACTEPPLEPMPST